MKIQNNKNISIKELNIVDNKNGSKDKKRLVAVFKFEDGKKKNIKFGSFNSITFFDIGDEQRKENYIKRHKALGTENWNNILSAGALSKLVLWQFENAQSIEKYINRKFKIPKVSINISKNKIK